MPFWRVVVEARLTRGSRKLLRRYEAAVTAVFVWARTVEEAEGLAALALEAEGLTAVTADASKHRPAAAPRSSPAAVARSPLRYLPRPDADAQPGQRPRRDART
jgi:hypothetical protein